MVASQSVQSISNLVWWIARAGAVASLAILGLFIGAHLLEAAASPTLAEWGMLLLFPGGVFVGLAIGLRYSGLGGAIACLSLAAFYIVHFLIQGNFPGGPYFAIFTAPALLLLGEAWLRRGVRADR